MDINKNNNDIKFCPFCAEQIKIDAIKCKHCGEIVSTGWQFQTRYFDKTRIFIFFKEYRWFIIIMAIISILSLSNYYTYNPRISIVFIWCFLFIKTAGVYMGGVWIAVIISLLFRKREARWKWYELLNVGTYIFCGYLAFAILYETIYLSS